MWHLCGQHSSTGLWMTEEYLSMQTLCKTLTLKSHSAVKHIHCCRICESMAAATQPWHKRPCHHGIQEHPLGPCTKNIHWGRLERLRTKSKSVKDLMGISRDVVARKCCQDLQLRVEKLETDQAPCTLALCPLWTRSITAKVR